MIFHKFQLIIRLLIFYNVKLCLDPETILQLSEWLKVRVNRFPKTTSTELNPRPPNYEPGWITIALRRILKLYITFEIHNHNKYLEKCKIISPQCKCTYLYISVICRKKNIRQKNRSVYNKCIRCIMYKIMHRVKTLPLVYLDG